MTDFGFNPDSAETGRGGCARFPDLSEWLLTSPYPCPRTGTVRCRKGNTRGESWGSQLVSFSKQQVLTNNSYVNQKYPSI
jgi:hypothetical protein